MVSEHAEMSKQGTASKMKRSSLMIPQTLGGLKVAKAKVRLWTSYMQQTLKDPQLVELDKVWCKWFTAAYFE